MESPCCLNRGCDCYDVHARSTYCTRNDRAYRDIWRLRRGSRSKRSCSKDCNTTTLHKSASAVSYSHDREHKQYVVLLRRTVVAEHRHLKALTSINIMYGYEKHGKTTNVSVWALERKGRNSSMPCPRATPSRLRPSIAAANSW